MFYLRILSTTPASYSYEIIMIIIIIIFIIVNGKRSTQRCVLAMPAEKYLEGSC